MSWECAECNDQSQTMVAICHHCGKPLCANDVVMILDDAFAKVHKKAWQEATHCRKCRRDHHLGSISLGEESR